MYRLYLTMKERLPDKHALTFDDQSDGVALHELHVLHSGLQVIDAFNPLTISQPLVERDSEISKNGPFSYLSSGESTPSFSVAHAVHPYLAHPLEIRTSTSATTI